MTREEILNKAHQLAEKYFPNSQNIWARPNIEAQKVKYACKEMFEWADKTMIEKACEWLKNNVNNYLDWYDWEECRVNTDNLLYDFRKAMDE